MHMEASLFLAKLVGLYLLIGGLLCLLRKSHVETTAKELVATRSALAVSGEFSLIFGLVIILAHSVWEPNWRGLLTLVGYLLVLRGIMRIAFPSYVKKLCTKTMGACCVTCAALMVIIGAFLTYSGFDHTMPMQEHEQVQQKSKSCW